MRAWRNEAGVPAGAVLPARLRAEGFAETAPLVARLARLDLEAGEASEAAPAAAVVVPGGTVELLPAPGVDPAEQERKLATRRAELEAEIARAEGKLANQGFIAKAPPQLVASEREKLERLVAELASL